MSAVSLQSVEEAAEAIKKSVHTTPILTCGQLDDLTGLTLFFKCENFQKTGSFKARGATNAVAHLPSGVKDVVTHSSGNHAQALAFAAKEQGIKAHIVMPLGAPSVKVNAVKGYGAQVYMCEPTQKSREETAAQVVERTGGAFVHPSNDPLVISGQVSILKPKMGRGEGKQRWWLFPIYMIMEGTVGLELLQQVPDLDAVIVPVGGGGLIGGIATAIKAVRPQCLVIGAEPEQADDAARSKSTGSLQEHDHPVDTIADGLKTTLGTHTFPIVVNKVDQIITVSEKEIARALLLVWERLKVLIEPSSAVGVAVALSDELRKSGMGSGKRVGIILCGGNMDMSRVAGILQLAGNES